MFAETIGFVFSASTRGVGEKDSIMIVVNSGFSVAHKARSMWSYKKRKIIFTIHKRNI